MKYRGFPIDLVGQILDKRMLPGYALCRPNGDILDWIDSGHSLHGYSSIWIQWLIASWFRWGEPLIYDDNEPYIHHAFHWANSPAAPLLRPSSPTLPPSEIYLAHRPELGPLSFSLSLSLSCTRHSSILLSLFSTGWPLHFFILSL